MVGMDELSASGRAVPQLWGLPLRPVAVKEDRVLVDGTFDIRQIERWGGTPQQQLEKRNAAVRTVALAPAGTYMLAFGVRKKRNEDLVAAGRSLALRYPEIKKSQANGHPYYVLQIDSATSGIDFVLTVIRKEQIKFLCKASRQAYVGSRCALRIAPSLRPAAPGPRQDAAPPEQSKGASRRGRSSLSHACMWGAYACMRIPPVNPRIRDEGLRPAPAPPCPCMASPRRTGCGTG